MGQFKEHASATQGDARNGQVFPSITEFQNDNRRPQTQQETYGAVKIAFQLQCRNSRVTRKVSTRTPNQLRNANAVLWHN